MAAPDGSTRPDLSREPSADFLRRAAEEVETFEPFALLRLAEAYGAALPRIGASRLPAQNVVDLTHTPHMSFPGPSLSHIRANHGRMEVGGYYLGMTGPMGALPLHLTEFAYYEGRYSKARPFGRFLDLLAGRILQFFYRAWADSQPVVHSDRPDNDRFAFYMAALTGAAEGVRPDAAFPARARLHYAGLYTSRRSVGGIEDGLKHLLRTDVTVRPFAPRWRDIETADRTRLGDGFNVLGQDAVIGAKVHGISDAFQVSVHTRSFRDYEDFLPTGRKFPLAAEALDAFSPSHLEWELELEIETREIPPMQLNGRTRLGWTSWLGADSRSPVRADTKLRRNARKAARLQEGAHHG